jgi:hypothetical protein
MFKRTVAILASAAVLALLITPSAQAAGPDELSEYGAAGSATALAINLFDQELAISTTTAAVGSLPQAGADGAALLVAGTPVPGSAPSSTPGGSPSNQVCPASADVDEVSQGNLSGLTLEIACLDTTATVTDGAPAATSGSGEATIVIRTPGGPLVEPLLGPVLDGVTQITDPLCETLLGLCELVDETTEINVQEVLDDIVTALGDDTFVLAEIAIAPTLSQASADSVDGVIGQAGTSGVVINLLPGIESTLAELTDLVDIENPSPDALLQVRLGAAHAEVVRDPVTGEAAPDASAAQLLGIGANESLGILGGLLGTLPAAIDDLSLAQLSCDGGVLADVVCIDLGGVHQLTPEELEADYPDFGAGVVGRRATAASVAVLPVLSEALGLGESVLGISLARAEAAGYAIPAEDPPAPEPPASRGPLPRTGGAPSLPLALGLFAAAAVGLAAVRRTPTV